MRVVLVLLAIAAACLARTPLERLEVRHLEAVHAQRVEWMKQRQVAPPAGVYQDFRAVTGVPTNSPEQLLRAAKGAEARVVFSNALSGIHEGVLFLDAAKIAPELPPFTEENLVKLPKGLEGRFKQYPDEVFAATGQTLLGTGWDRQFDAAFRNASTHILARDLTEASIRAALAEGHVYLAHDWLCDPTGFSFIAENGLGVFDIGDNVPILNTRIEARAPVQARLKLLRDGVVVAEASDTKLTFPVKEEGAYRLEAWLTADGEDRPWIYSNAFQIGKPPGFRLPPGELAPNVEVRRDIVYAEGDPADAPKHKLNLYLPKDKTNFPVLVFIHGGSWRTGDRGLYGALGNRFAKAGIGVAIPSYRLMPGSPHPAQIEDVAAAFAWVYKNVEQFGGDAKRIYLAGHSAGAHLVALLALDGEYLKKREIPANAIHGVAAISGVYDVSRLPAFLSDPGARDASPLHHLHQQAPPFLITYCQWDYLGLPKQANDFAAALKKDFAGAELVYIPGKSHIMEIVDIWQEDDALARAILNFVK